MIAQNIHSVLSVEVSKLISYNGSRWRVIDINTEETQIQIDLFPAKNDIEIQSPTPIPKLTTFGPNRRAIIIGEKTYYYSYETLVAYSDATQKIRIQSYNKTTNHHILTMGVAPFTILENDEFLALIS